MGGRWVIGQSVTFFGTFVGELCGKVKTGLWQSLSQSPPFRLCWRGSFIFIAGAP